MIKFDFTYGNIEAKLMPSKYLATVLLIAQKRYHLLWSSSDLKSLSTTK